MANIITGVRILCSIALLFVTQLSKLFYALYLTAGLSDMIDGTVARKTGTESEFGSKLDSTADLMFVTVCLLKLLPVLNKLTGMLTFVLPLTLRFFERRYTLVAVCSIATLAAIQEGHFIRAE